MARMTPDEWRKKKEEQKNGTSVASATPSTSSFEDKPSGGTSKRMTPSEWYAQKASTSADWWAKASISLINEMHNTPKEWSYKDQYSTYSSRITDLLAKADGWRKQHRGNAEVISYIDSVVDNLSKAESYSLGYYNLYSKFESEDAYKTAVSGWLNPEAETNETTVAMRKEKYESNLKRIEEIKAALPGIAKTFLPSSVEKVFLSDGADALMDEWETLEAENNQYKHTQGVLDDYYVPVTPEFTQNAAYRNYSNATRDELWDYDVSAMNGSTALSNGGSFDDEGNILDSKGNIVQYANGPVVDDKLGLFLSATEDDITEAYNRLTATNGNYTDTWANLIQEGDVNGWKHLKPKELDIYYDLLKREGQEAAYRFLDAMTTELTRRETQATTEWINSQDGWAQFGLNVASIPMNVFGGAVSFADDAINILQGEKINPYSRAHSFQNAATDIRSKTAEDINTLTGNVALPWVGTTFGDVYQSLMSAADSGVGVLLGGNAYGVLMGMGAASSEMKRLYDQGASMGQITAGGILAGAAEMVFEKYSIDKLVKMDDSKRKIDIVINLLKQGGIEASEEVLTEIANTITNAIVMGSQSDWVDVNTFVKNVVNAGIGGFISGGVSGGVGATANYVNYGKQTTKYGQRIIDKGGVDPIQQLASDMSADKSALNARSIGKLSDKVSKKATAKNVGKLADLMGDTVNAQNTADIAAALEEKGLSKKEAKRVAEYLNKATQGEYFTDKEAAEIEGDERITEVYLGLIGDSKSDVNTRTQNLSAALNVEEYRRLVEAAQQSQEAAETTGGKVVVAEAQNEVQAAQVEPVEAPAANDQQITGKLTGKESLQVAEESTVAEEAETKTVTLEEASQKYGAQAKAMISTYTAGQDVAKYDAAYQVAYDMGKSGVSLSYAMNSETTQYLTDAQRKNAYNTGKDAADTDAKAKNAENQKAANGKIGRKKGSVRGDGVTVKDLDEAFNMTQSKAYKYLVDVAEATGIDIVLYRSKPNANGEFEDAQGKYSKNEPGTLYIDLNAGLRNTDDANKLHRYFMLRTFAHEFTHFIERWNPIQYNEFRKVVFDTMTERGENVHDLIEDKQRQNPGMSYDEASREVVAEAMVDILPDSNFVQELAQKHKTIFQKLLEKLKEFVDNLRAYFDNIGGSYNRGAIALKEQAGETVKYLDSIVKMWDQIAVQAVENYQLTVAGDEVAVAENETTTTEAAAVSETKNVPENDTHEEVEKSVPPKAEIEEAKQELRKAVRMPIQGTNAEALLAGINSKELSMDSITLSGSVEGFNVEQREYLVRKLLDGVYTQSETIKIDVPYDGKFEISNTPGNVAKVLESLKVKVRQEALFDKKTISLLTSNGDMRIVKMDDSTFLTNSYVMLPAVDSAVEYVKKEHKAKESALHVEVEKAIQRATNPLNDAPTEAKLGKTPVLIFEIDGKVLYFDKRFFAPLDGGQLYYAEVGGAAILKSVDESGNVLGYLMGIRPGDASKVTDRKPSKLASFRKKPNQDSVSDTTKKESQKKPPAEKSTKPKTVESSVKLEDFGEKIGGARKDQWSKRGLLADDLTEMNDREREKNVKKDNVWKRPDYRKLIEGGADRNVLFARNEIRKALNQTIRYPYGATEGRRLQIQKEFVDTVREIQAMAEEATSKEDFSAMGRQWLIAHGFMEQSGKAYTDKWRKNPALQSSDYVYTIEHLVRNFDNLTKLADKANFAIDAEKKIPSGFNIHEDKITGTWFIAKGSWVIKHSISSYDEALNFLRNAAATNRRKTRFVPQQLLEVHRKGPDYRSGKDVSGQDYLEVFKFRGGEFGNWMNEKDRRVSMNYGFDALKDLADAIGIADSDISLSGNLSIAFGARGQGLSGAAAHYERERHVINLTKMNGAGSLAHEWFHALDDFIGGYGSNMATDSLRGLPDGTKTALRDLLTTMQYRDATQEETDMAATKSYEQAKRSVTYQVKNQFNWVEKVENGTFSDADARYYARKPTEADAKKYHELLDKLLETGDASIVDELSTLRKEVNGRVIPKEDRESIGYRLYALKPSATKNVQKMRLRSDFYNNSRRFGELHQKDGDYWDSTVEMAARAFACYVADKTGKLNDYLSAHSDSAVTLDMDKTGNLTAVRAYPTGQERENINAAFDRLIGALKADGFLHDRGETARPDVVQYQNRKYLSDEQTLDSMAEGDVQYKARKYLERKSDRPNRRRALVEREMVNEFHDALSAEEWHRYYDRIIDGKYNPDLFEDNDLATVTVGSKLLLVQMQSNGEFSVKAVWAYQDVLPPEDVIKEMTDYYAARNYGKDEIISWLSRIVGHDGQKLFIPYNRYGGQYDGVVQQSPAGSEHANGLLAETGSNGKGLLEIPARSDVAEDHTQNQQRTDTLTDREVLSMAVNLVQADELTSAEKDALDIFKKRLTKLEALQAKRSEQGRLYKEQQFGPNVDRAAAEKTRNRMHILDDQIRDASAELLSVEKATVLRKVLQKARKIVELEERQRGDEKLKRWRDRRNESAEKKSARAKLQKLVLDTVKWISHPTKTDVKCPDILKRPYSDFLNSIDLSSKRLADGGDPTKNDLRFANAMGSLATALDKIMSAQDPTQDVDNVLDTGYLDLPANFVEKLRDTTEQIKDMMVDGDYVVNTMTAADVRKLSQMIRTLNHAIKTMSRLYANMRFANIEALGVDTMEFMDALGELEKTSGIKDFVQWDNALPYYAFKRFGAGGESVFEGLMDAQDKLAFLAQKIFDFSENAWTDKEAKAWSEDTHTIDLPNGNKLTLTTADAMSIYCLSRREQGLQHLLGGGTRVMGIQKGSKKAKDSRSVLTIKDIDTIVSSLTDRQRSVAETIQDFMSTTCSEWGNEISMKRFLTKEFTEKFYFPIESNDENLPTKDPAAQQSDLFRLLNISATKPITPGANNEVIIRNIFDVFTSHASDMARLNAYGMALLDYMKWLNYREKTTNGDGQINVRGVRKSMEQAFGNAAKSYVLNLIKDVNGRPSDGGLPSFYTRMVRNAKTAMVGNSLRVATLQITSYPRAALVLSLKSLALGLSKVPNIKRAKKYCGIALWKSFGFYDTNISRSIEDQMKGVKNVQQKLIELSLKGAEWGDAITWGALWNACEYEVASTKQYKVGSEEFYQEVGKKLREVVYRTQVVDSTLTRSEMMRSKNTKAQELSAFMSEPTLSANILMDAGFQLSMENRRSGSIKTAWKNTGKYVGRAVAVYSIGQLAAALLEGLWDAYRDDEDEKFGKKYLDAFIENLALDLLPINKIPIISELAEAVLSLAGLGYFSSDNLSSTAISQTVAAVKAWVSALSGESSTTVYNALYKTTRAVSSFYGVSFSGFMREGVALWNNTAGAYDSTLKIRQYELSKGDLGNELYEAIIAGDTRQADSLRAQFEDEDSMHSAVRKAMCENDPRIKEAALAQLNGDPSERGRIAKEVIADGFAQDDVVLAINSEIADMTPDESSGAKKKKGFYTAEDFAKEISNNDQAAANAARFDIIQTAKNNGKTETEAVKSFNSSAKTALKEQFLAGDISEQEAMNALTTYCGDTQEDADKRVSEWAFENEYGFAWSKRADAYTSGDISASALKTILITDGGMTSEEADYQIEVYDWQAQGYDGATAAAVREYNEHCAGLHVPKDVYLHIRLFANNTENDTDANGKTIYYSAMKKIMAEINAQSGLTGDQKSAIARSLGWAEKNIQKYKTW